MSYSVDIGIYNRVHSAKFIVKNHVPNLGARDGIGTRFSIGPTTAGIRIQNINTAAIMANVFVAFRAEKNPTTKLILFADFSGEL